MNHKNIFLLSALAAGFLFLTGFSILGDEATLSRHAQISVKAKYPHPYYRAAFVLTGNGN